MLLAGCPTNGSALCAPLYKSRLEINSSALLHGGAWHHVAVTKAADGTIKLVVDGAVQGTGSVSSDGLSLPTAPPSRAPSARSAARSAGWLTLGDLCMGGSGKVKKQSNEVPCSSYAAKTEMYDGRMKNIAIYDEDVTASFIAPPQSPPPSPLLPPAPPAQPETKLTGKPPPPDSGGGGGFPVSLVSGDAGGAGGSSGLGGGDCGGVMKLAVTSSS